MNKIYKLIVVTLFLTLPSLHAAELKLAPLFSSDMVLQRGVSVPVWGWAEKGRKVTVSFGGQERTATADANGKWQVTLKAMPASAEPRTLSVSSSDLKAQITNLTCTNVLVGEVWLCSGQSNMQFGMGGTTDSTQHIAQAADVLLRLFTVPNTPAETPRCDMDSKGPISWKVASPETVRGFSAVAYFFGRDLRKDLKIPVGLIHSSWGGTPAEAWTAKEMLEADPMLKKLIENWDEKIAKYDPVKANEKYKAALANHNEAVAKAKAEGKPAPRGPSLEGNPAKSQNRPANLFNGMIAPLVPYALKGAIWYQGESNSSRAKEYQTLFPAMIKCWRNNWNNSAMPFLFVQIAPHNGMCPEIREAQLLTSQRVKNTAMAVITDHGNATDIHPKQKEPVGARLALAARVIAYGEKIESSGPVYKSIKVKNGKAILSFTHIGDGLVAKDGALKGFTIAGADKNFVPATAEISGKTIIVASDKVTTPVAVRFGWVSVPDVNLFNQNGLPATPFRTDSW